MARSSFEEKIDENSKASKLDVSYEPIVLPTLVPWKYKPDYMLRTKSGKLIIIEAKGYLKHFDSGYRKRWLQMYKTYKDKYDIRIIFQHDKLLPHSKKMTTVKWAEKHGIQYHVGEEIPKEWADE